MSDPNNNRIEKRPNINDSERTEKASVDKPSMTEQTKKPLKSNKESKTKKK